MTKNQTVRKQLKRLPKSFWAVMVLAIISLLGLIATTIICYAPKNQVTTLTDISLCVGEVAPLNAELAVFIFLIIFGSLVVITFIVIIVWLLILRFKTKSKVKIPLPSQELNSPSEVYDMEGDDAQ